jgi:hypothetical protein
MLRHYYTLYHITEELRHLQGWYLTECFTQDKGVALLCFESPTTSEAVYVECSTDVQNGYVLLRPEFHRARKNTRDVFPTLIGHTLRGVELVAGERIISLLFPIGTLHCVLFGGKQAAGYASGGNIILTQKQSAKNETGEEKDRQRVTTDARMDATMNVTTDARMNVATSVIADAFKSREDLMGTVFQPSPPNVQPFASFPPDTSLLATLSQCDILLGKIYATEVLYRLADETGTDFDALCTTTLEVAQHGQLDENLADRAERVAYAVRDECLRAQEFFLCRDANGKPLVSLIALREFAPERSFTNLSEALRTRIGIGLREQTFHTQRASILARTRSALAKIERTLENMARDHASVERATERQLFAELLLAQPNINIKGLRELQAQSWSGDWVTIPLNPALTLRENADEYFAKVRTANQSAAKRTKRKAEYEREAERTRQAIAAVECAEDLASLERIMKDIGKEFEKEFGKAFGVAAPQAAAANSASQQVAHKFREFDLGEGYTLYVGKAAADNDELTVRFAKPHDYWFHARGVAGSHAVLRGPHKDKKPPKYVVESAASIAAYYSKARNAKMTPVAYTQKKYVRKPKGAAPGAVVMEREDVIMAAPRLPQGVKE